jgi:hypothetical protein
VLRGRVSHELPYQRSAFIVAWQVRPRWKTSLNAFKYLMDQNPRIKPRMPTQMPKDEQLVSHVKPFPDAS